MKHKQCHSHVERGEREELRAFSWGAAAPPKWPLITTMTFLPNTFLPFNESEIRRKHFGWDLSPKGCHSNGGRGQKNPEIYSDVHLKAADPGGRSRTDASAVLLSRVSVGWTKGGDLYCRIKMFHFQSQTSVKAGEGQNPPPQVVCSKAGYLWGQCRCRVLFCAAVA